MRDESLSEYLYLNLVRREALNKKKYSAMKKWIHTKETNSLILRSKRHYTYLLIIENYIVFVTTSWVLKEAMTP